jgi:hypothetical protein
VCFTERFPFIFCQERAAQGRQSHRPFPARFAINAAVRRVDFRRLRLPPCFQRVTVSVRYDRNRTANPTPRLCPRQHLRPDARRSLSSCARTDAPRFSARRRADRRELLKLLRAQELQCRRGDDFETDSMRPSTSADGDSFKCYFHVATPNIDLNAYVVGVGL